MRPRTKVVRRWKSPQTAAKLAQRAAKEAEHLHKEKRNWRLIIIGVAMVSIGLIVADYCWLQHRARQRHEQRHRQSMRTNSPASSVGQSGNTNTAKSK